MGFLGENQKMNLKLVFILSRKNFNGLQPLPMNSLEDINFHIHGFQFQNSKVLMDLNEAMQKLRTWIEKDPLGVLKSELKFEYIRLYHSYLHFLQQNSFCARDFKTFI